MIDEAVLEELLAQVADEIPVPVAGPEQVMNALTLASHERRRARPNIAKPLMIAAAAVLVVLAAVPVLQNVGSSSSDKSSAASPTSVFGAGASQKHRTGANTSGDTSSGSSSGAVDAAKIVKTGALDLQVPHGSLRVAVNRVTGVAVGLVGYVSNSRTSYGGSSPTAQITIRVPAGQFETAITRLEALAGVNVLAERENGTDVTAQYVDLQAQLAAATSARDALLVVLSNAESVGDILAVQDRVTAAQTQVEQLQRRINALGDQAAFSSLAVTLSEKPSRAEAAALHGTDGGLSKAWADARHGFSSGIEWIVARSGGALIVLLAALAILFGIRYLYPIVRRGLL
jgi:uncharacterized protein DUF4349